MQIRLLALSALVAAGCQTSTEPVTPAPAEPTADAPASDAPATDASYEAVQGGARGITVIGSDGVSTEVGLGTPRDAAVASLTPFFGAPEESTPEECGADPGMRTLTWSNGVALNISSDGNVAGWEGQGTNERIQTASGVQLGAPLDMTRQTDPTFALVDGSTLEGEFTLGETDAEGNRVAGIMSADGARVEHLFAGQNCFVR